MELDTYHICDHRMTDVLGREKGLILKIIFSWMMTNERNGHRTSFKEGKWWTFNPLSAWCKQIKDISPSTLHRRFKALEAEGWIYTGVFNRHKYDRTKWYSVNLDKFAEHFPHIMERERQVREKRGQPTDISHFSNCKMDIPDCKMDIAKWNNDTNKHYETSNTKESSPPEVFEEETLDNNLDDSFMDEIAAENQKAKDDEFKPHLEEIRERLKDLNLHVNDREFDAFINEAKYQRGLSPQQLLEYIEKGKSNPYYRKRIKWKGGVFLVDQWDYHNREIRNRYFTQWHSYPSYTVEEFLLWIRKQDEVDCSNIEQVVAWLGFKLDRAS